MVKNLPAHSGDIRDASSIPRSGGSPEGGHGNPLQYPCLENPKDRGAWRAAVHGVAKSWTWLSEFHFLHLTHIKSYSTVLWRCTRPRTNTHKRCPFHYRGLECQSRKSRNIWSNRQIWPWSTEWSRVKANRILPREHTGHTKHPLPTTQEKTLHMDIIRWSTPKSDWLYSLQPKMEKLYTVSKNKTGRWLQLRSWTHYCQIQT